KEVFKMSRKEKEREKVEKFMVIIIIITFITISIISIVSGIVYYEKNKTILADRKHHSAEILSHEFKKGDDKINITLSDGDVIIYNKKKKTIIADRKHNTKEIVSNEYKKDDDKITITLSDGVVFKSYKSIFNDKNNYESNIAIDKDNIKNGNIITYIKNNDKF